MRGNSVSFHPELNSDGPPAELRSYPIRNRRLGFSCQEWFHFHGKILLMQHLLHLIIRSPRSRFSFPSSSLPRTLSPLLCPLLSSPALLICLLASSLQHPHPTPPELPPRASSLSFPSSSFLKLLLPVNTGSSQGAHRYHRVRFNAFYDLFKSKSN